MSHENHDPVPKAKKGMGLRVLSGEAAGAVDPVCGMRVDPATAKHSTEHEGTTYFFCCGGCKAKFEADPAKFLAGHREPMGRGGHGHGGHGHGGHDHAGPAAHDQEAATAGAGEAIDPVCGMTVDVASSTIRSEHGGETIHFCSEHCKKKFDADPEAYLGGKPKPAPAAAPPGTKWICPMCPSASWSRV